MTEQQCESCEQLNALFDLRRGADQRAIKRWQAATGKTRTWPDHADLCCWLMDEIERLESKVDRLLAKDAVAADEERNIRQYELERQRKMPWWKLLLGFHRTNTSGPK